METQSILQSELKYICIPGNCRNIWTCRKCSRPVLHENQKNTNSFLRGISFQKNFNFYITSLATSDILSSLISVPVTIISLLSDSHSIQSGWGCKATMYFIILFPTITMSDLLVVSIEKYLSTRSAPRTLKFLTVKKLVLFAWLEGCLIVCFPAATFDGVRYSVNDTHYTVICRYNNHYLQSRPRLFKGWIALSTG